MKKNILIALLTPFFFLTAFSQGLERIIVEEIPVDATIASMEDKLSADAVCYRIFIDMADNYGLSVVTGTASLLDNDIYPMSVSTTTEFYNSKFGNTCGNNIIPESAILSPGIIYDSYISVGGIMNDRVAVPFDLDDKGYIEIPPPTTMHTPGLDLTMFGSANSSVAFSTSDGSWNGIKLGGIKGPAATDSTIVFIGQFTTDGVLSFKLNVQLRGKLSETVYFTEGYYAESGKWYKPLTNSINFPEIQYSMLENVYGPGIVHPEVSLTVPTKDTLVPIGANVAIKAQATDVGGTIDSVEFRINSVVVAVDKSAPYELIHEFLQGKNIVTAVAIDNQGARSASSPVLVSAYNLPQITFVKPVSDTTIELDSTLNIAITISHPDKGANIDSVMFITGKDTIGVLYNAPYETFWKPDAVGDYELIVFAFDDKGKKGISPTRLIHVKEGIPPTISIVSHKANDTIFFGTESTIAAEADDEDGKVAQVSFFINDQKIGEDNEAPFAINWQPTGISTYTIHAMATDDEGNRAVSPSVPVKVIEEPSGTIDRAETESLSIYPNPANDFITVLIESVNNPAYRYSVINASGRVVLQGEIKGQSGKHASEINVSSLQRGLYILKVTTINGTNLCKQLTLF